MVRLTLKEKKNSQYNLIDYAEQTGRPKLHRQDSLDRVLAQGF